MLSLLIVIRIVAVKCEIKLPFSRSCQPVNMSCFIKVFVLISPNATSTDIRNDTSQSVEIANLQIAIC